MKFLLKDGSAAHLVSVIQDQNYRPGYRQLPSDAITEITRLAEARIPKDCWRPAPIVFIGSAPELLNNLLREKNLPSVLCIGLFYSIRGGTGANGKASYLYVVWLQEEFAPHMTADNQLVFAQIKWPDAHSPSP